MPGASRRTARLAPIAGLPSTPRRRAGTTEYSGNPEPVQALPAHLTTLVGRRREAADVRRLLTRARLVTLTGPGGVGKTRLALLVASRLSSRLWEGVWLVNLASIGDGALIGRTVASSLGLREQSGRSIESTLVGYLRSRRTILLFDNCEHLIDACAQLVERLLLDCPRLSVLATTREPLAVPGEHVYPVSSLPLPKLDATTGTWGISGVAETIAQTDAVALFVDRATAAAPTFRLTESNAAAVARICLHLDGLALAIELVAAHVKAISVDQIADQLDERFWVLTGGSRTSLTRHRTLRASMDWSYDLLPGSEQTLLRALSVFAGGFTMEAADALRAASPDQNAVAPTEPTIALLERLVDRSLVVADFPANGSARYRLLGVIRQYGLKKLRAAAEEERVRRCHASMYTSIARRAGRELFGTEQVAWFDRLDREHDNIRASFDWLRSALERGEAASGEAALELGAALGWFWIARGYYTEGRNRLLELLTLIGPSIQTPARVDALHHAAACCYIVGDRPPIRDLLDEALSLGTMLGYARGTAMALKGLAVLSEEAGDWQRAENLFEEGLSVARAAGDPVATYLLLIWRADLDRSRGYAERAAELLEESLRLSRAQEDHWWMGHALSRLAHLAFIRGDFARAATLGHEDLRRRWGIGDRHGAAWSLELLAWVAGARGQAHRAARLLGAAEAARERTGARLLPKDQDDHARTVTAAQRALGDAALAAAWSDGQPRSPERAVDDALAADGPSISATTVAGVFGAGRLPDQLTRREREVADLVARGTSNREIAARLVISRGTVANHVAHILGKLGFHSRVQIARWAAERRIQDREPG